MTETREESLQKTGACALASLREMVAALECDYDRLEELRESKAGWTAQEDAEPGSIQSWDEYFPDDAAELDDLEEAAGDCTDREDADTRIQEDALSVRIFGERISGEWEADKFEILLTTGGPAVRIMGEIGEHGEPSRAWLEVQDWGTPWTEYYETGVGDVCLTYARCFCFEGGA